MAKFCANCGKEIETGVAFCTECGTVAPTEESTVRGNETNEINDSHEKMKKKPVADQGAYREPAPAYFQDNRMLAGSNNGVVKTGTYFWLMFLFAIPVAGWVVCLIIAFTSKNESKKNFAKAMLIWLIIALILCAIMFFAVSWISDMVIEYVNEATGGQLGDMQDLLKQLNQFDDSGLSMPAN